MKRTALITMLLLACTACAPQTDNEANTEMAFAPELNVDLDAMTKSASGLYTQDLKVGDGQVVQAGQSVAVHYTGWLPDGSKFDSSLDRGEPLELVVGRGMVIRGWDEGLQGMKVGGKRKLVIPPQLAYGDQGAGGVIPPGATLVFDVELVAVR